MAIDSTTLFVDNLPLSIRNIWVHNLFVRFGPIREVFIPNKKSKITGQQFGFVRLLNSKDVHIAMKNTNGHWFWGHKLVVHVAKFGAGTQNQQRSPSLSRKGNRLVYKVKSTKAAESSLPNQEHPNVRIFKGAGMSSLLCNAKNFHIQSVGNGWLFSSAVAKISKLVSPHYLESIFKKENIPIVHIKAMGGRYVIITFNSPESRDAILKEKWLSIWFEDIHPWNGEAAKYERFVWLSCVGMPLNGWTYPNFKIIGDAWGHFLQTDEATLCEVSYDKGRILITTDQIQRITGSIEFDICGIKYAVSVEEESTFRTIVSNLFPPKYATVNTVEQNDEEERKQSENDDDLDNPKSNTAADKADEVAKTNLVNYREMASESSNNAEERDANENVEETPVINEVVEKLDLTNLNAREPNAATFKSILMVPSPIEKAQFSPRSAKVPLALDKTTLIVPTQSQNSCYEPVDNYVNTYEIINAEELSDREVDDVSSWSMVSFNRNLKPKGAEKYKRKQKSVEELIGIPKPKKGGRKKNKNVVFRAAIAAAALSVSSNGIKNRNRIILNEEEAVKTVSKIIGEDYMGDEDEVISNIMIMNKVGEHEIL